MCHILSTARISRKVLVTILLVCLAILALTKYQNILRTEIGTTGGKARPTSLWPLKSSAEQEKEDFDSDDNPGALVKDNDDNDYSGIELVTPKDLKHLYRENGPQLSLQEKMDQGIMKESDEIEDVLQNNTNILVLAYARSGSSYTGDLMSALARASYFFEPLWVLNKMNGQSIEKTVIGDKKQVELVRDTITGLFNCDSKVLQQMKSRSKFRIMRKNGKVCNATNPKVIKTIRLHKAGLEPWIYESDIKVVHLVRDPRGMIRSVAAGSWGASLKNATIQCNRYRDDISLEEGLGKNYIRVRYEDLVDRPEEELQRIYHHLHMPLTGEVRKVIYEHTHAPQDAKKGYYNTFRSEDFRHDSWKDKLPASTIEKIEEGCKDIMEKLNYKPYKPATTEKSQQ